ncbi:MAG: DUF6642 family protein [Phycisphaerales bacterium]
MRRSAYNIFCLEGDWYGDLKNPSTVRPVFDLLRQVYPNVNYIYRSIGTPAEFKHFLGVWKQRRFADYPILYLAFHGSPGKVHVGDQRRREGVLSLDEISRILGSHCKGRLIHFGACSVLAGDRRHLTRFLASTGALAISGYRTDIGWMHSAAFEVFLLMAMQMQKPTRSGAAAVERRVHEMAGKQARELTFRMEVAQ